MHKRGLAALVLCAALLSACAGLRSGGAGTAPASSGQTPPAPPAIPAPPPATPAQPSAGPSLKLITLFFMDATHGWAGALSHDCDSSTKTDCRGFLFRTGDAGATWETAYSGDVAPLALQLSPDGTGWLAGGPASRGSYGPWLLSAQGKLLQTTDGGKSWHPRYSGIAADGAFMGISFTSASNGWLGTAAGHLLQTVDGGKSWAPGSASCANWVSFVSPQEGFSFCGFPINPGPGMASKDFLRTTDAGASWHLVERVTDSLPRPRDGLPLTGYGVSFSMRTAMDGWIALSRGGLLHTTDGGNTWQSHLAERAARGLPPVDDGGAGIDYSEAEAVQFLSALQGYALLDRQYLMQTTDGGKNWRVLLDAAKLPATK